MWLVVLKLIFIIVLVHPSQWLVKKIFTHFIRPCSDWWTQYIQPACTFVVAQLSASRAKWIVQMWSTNPPSRRRRHLKLPRNTEF
jgi:hypothetical protein